MKARNVILCLVAIVIFFQSCIPSLHPLYTSDKLVMKKEILGVWIDSESEYIENLTFSNDGKPIAIDPFKNIPSVWTFETDGEKNYHLECYDEKSRLAAFDAHLVKLGTEYFFDFYPTSTKEEAKNTDPYAFYPLKFNDFEAYHYYPVHTFAKVTFNEEEISMAMFDGELLGNLLKQKRIRIKHEETDQGFILTAQSEELQQFIVKYAADENAFLNPIVLKKPT